MAKDSQAPKNNLVLFSVIGLSILLLVVLIINNGRSSSEPESPIEETQTSQEASENDETSVGGDESGDDIREDRDDVIATEPPEDLGELPEGLPAGWRELSNAEKTALNPFNCPVDANGVVYLSAETGECLELEEEEEEEEGDDGRQINIPDDALVVSLGEAFRYGDSSEISVGGISCTNLEFVILSPHDLNLTIGQVLRERSDDYEAYKADPSALTRDYLDRSVSLSYLDYFEYLQNFEHWRDANISSSASDDLADQLFGYLDCEISMTLKNIGEDSSFSSGCRWDFDGSLSLIGERQTYGQENRDQLPIGIACTQAIVDFPTGATDDDTVSFIVSSEDTILEIVIQNDEDTFRVVLDRN